MLYVIALGGNVLSKNESLYKLSSQVSRLVEQGDRIVITHGNGPQVGGLALYEKKNLALLTAETQIEMGSEIKRSLLAIPNERKRMRVKIVPTRVVVNKGDKEFENPTKPIGKFYSEKEANRLRKRGFVMKHLLDGYRRVAPSPKPQKIIEYMKIKHLLKEGYVVIAAGGGGIAVVKKGKKLEYADAVIDKDLTSSLLAIKLNADMLFILTKVNGIFLNFETKKEKKLNKVKVNELQKYVKQGHFEPGSMLPKVEACISFVKRTGKMAVVGNLEKVDKVLMLKESTILIP